MGDDILTLHSPCKVNLFLNVLDRRCDGFHEIETLIYPVPIYDELRLQHFKKGIQLTCNDARLKIDETNLVHRAATAFFRAVDTGKGVSIHLQKNLPIAAGIGAGSANAAFTLRGLNELWGFPLSQEKLVKLATALGSDVPFFLQDKPAEATGRGEEIHTCESLWGLKGTSLLLVNPGFGISTPWAYREYSEYRNTFRIPVGRTKELTDLLSNNNLGAASGLFHNSLEAPVFAKHVILPIIKRFLHENGAIVSMMSGSGATMFALVSDRVTAEKLRIKYHERFGQLGWSQTVLL